MKVDEILVHISTPATRQNDQLYRSLADAYLDFESHQTHRDEVRQDSDGHDLSSITHVEHSLVPEEGVLGSVPADNSILSTSKESYGSFPSYLSSGFHKGRTENANTDLRSADVDNGSIPTSSRLARLDRSYKHWKDKTTPKSSFVNGQKSRDQILRTPEDADTGFIEDTQLGAQALQSQLQDNYSTTDEDTSDEEAEPNIPPLNESSGSNGQDHTEQMRLDVLASEGSTQLATSPNTSEKQPSLEKLKATPQLSSPVRQTPSEKQNIVNTHNHPTEAFDFSTLHIDAYPPAPKVSTERPSKLPSQITKHLAALKLQNPNRFAPSKKLGSPKPDDRGYWAINCSTWPTQTQHDFWTSLCEHVSSGRLGWGTTLHRDASSSSALGHVRLYCWAEVIEHTWLLLWICSNGEILGSGSWWINADGEPVFEAV
jgi:hypothetical protein